MRQRCMTLILMALVLLLGAAPAFAQGSYGSIKGVCKDADGKPIAGAVVNMVSNESGRKYDIKTNAKGEYFSLGIAPAETYTVKLLKDGQVLDQALNFKVSTGENQLDFDIKALQTQAAQQKGVDPAQVKKMQEQQEKVTKENTTIKALNEKMAAANTAATAGDYETAIASLTEATQMDASRDVVWARLADAYRNSAIKQTDAAEKTKRLSSAADDYLKAVELKQAAMKTGTPKPEDNKQLAGYYNNLGDAAGKSGKTEDAIKAYTEAAQLNPEGDAGYYFNMGAVLTNVNRIDEAIAAFDKSLAADPNKAESYYWKGVNLVSKATTDPKTGKIIAAPGTQEALNKYLELQPTGPFAEGAKGMIQYVGGTIETTFGTRKGTPKVVKK